MEASLQELCRQLPLSQELWAAAELEDVVRYLRGGTGLRIPEEWRGAVPPFL